MNNLKVYPVWDACVRWFHWINVLCVIGLTAVGLVILNAKTLGLGSEGKILLKTCHVWIGYVFACNLLIRLIWAFVGGRFARWKAILPLGKDYRQQLSEYRAGLKAGKPPVYRGHNPMGRLMVTLLLLLLTTQASTGLILAGTDVYMAPFGESIRESVALDKNQLSLVQPYSDVNIDPQSYKTMRAWRKPVITVHYWSFYTLLAAIILHIGAVVLAEVRSREGLVTAMFSGYKSMQDKPVDE